MEAGAILLFLVALAFATFWLGVYIYVLYNWGRRLAERFRIRFTPTHAAIAFGVVGAVVALPSTFLDIDIIYKACLAFGIWLIHAEPISVGYWAGYDIGRGEDLSRWEQKTEEWLSDWEEETPSFMKNWEE